MKKFNFWKLMTFGLLGVLCLSAGAVASAGPEHAAKVALKNLMTAEMNIANLPIDESGHRKKALTHARAAILEMRAYVSAAPGR